jgi:hypothetical protein
MVNDLEKEPTSAIWKFYIQNPLYFRNFELSKTVTLVLTVIFSEHKVKQSNQFVVRGRNEHTKKPKESQETFGSHRRVSFVSSLMEHVNRIHKLIVKPCMSVRLLVSYTELFEVRWFTFVTEIVCRNNLLHKFYCY